MPNAFKDPPKWTGRPANPGTREVAFILNSPGAASVYLCGDFNEWSPTGLPMIERIAGRLREKRLMLPPRRYEYKFIVDGVWTHNPVAGKNIPNVFGTLNSVMEVRS